jgi:hypothetical protein
MTNTCSTSTFAARTHLLKLQLLYIKDLHITCNLLTRPRIRELRVVFSLPYVCDYMKKLRKKQEEITENHKYENVRKHRARRSPCTENVRGQNLMVVKHKDVQMTKMEL